jgi:hypothetical protein
MPHRSSPISLTIGGPDQTAEGLSYLLPIKTTIDDIDRLSAYLKTQVGWVPIDRAKKTIEARLVDNRKLSAAHRIGLLERDGPNIRLTPNGFEYANATEESVKNGIMRQGLNGVELYRSTLEWIHHSSKENPTKTDIGNYWDQSHAGSLEGAEGAALTDAVIFFMRVADAAGLGKFISAGNNRPVASFRTDPAAVRDFVLHSAPPPADPNGGDGTKPPEGQPAGPPAAPPAGPPAGPPAPPVGQVKVSTNPNIHVNIEIHIAADATATTIEEIFKNMSRYVLKQQTADVESD